MPVTLITQDEINDLPLENDPQAFVTFERICRDEMNRLLSHYGQNDNEGEVWFEYMTQVGAAAEAYEVEELMGYKPTFDHETFQNFYGRSVQVATKLSLQGRREVAAHSVELTAGTKARLKLHSEALKEALDQSDLSDALKKSLARKLNEFDDELEKERSSLAKLLSTVALVAAALVAPVGLLGTAEDDLIKLPKAAHVLLQITQIIGHAKAQEIERTPAPVKLPRREPPKALEDRSSPSVADDAEPRERFAADLDDEIPF